MKRLGKVIYIIRHKIVLIKLWIKYDTNVSLYRVLSHDTMKLFNTLILGVNLSNKLHIKHAKHHNIKTVGDFYDAYLDWASARRSKNDKPLDAIQTAEEFYPHLLGDAKKHFERVKFK